MENENDLPPLVLRARLEAQVAGVAVAASGSGGESSGSGVASTPTEGARVIVLDPETLVRRRPGAPLTPDPTRVEGRVKPTLKRALEIAESPALVHRARVGYQQLAYAAGTMDTKASMFKAWCEVMATHDLAPLPLTTEKCQLFVSVFRAAGFRTTYNYLVEARQRHLKEGFGWNEQLELCIKECKRVCTRGIGPTRRSEEIRMEWMQEAWELDGGVVGPPKPEGPHGGLLVWALGCHFLLREVELACLTLHKDIVHLDHDRKTITLALAAPKTDPGGRGVKRTLPCCGKRTMVEFHGLNCPFDVAQELIARQEERTQVDPCSLLAHSMPLVGQEGAPRLFVSKVNMVETAQADAARIAARVQNASDIDVQRLTGHFMRRSGAKALARSGTPIELIKHMSRHSTNVVQAYVEEALEEAPNAPSMLADYRQTQKLIEECKDELQALKKARASEPTVETVSSSSTGQPLVELQGEVRLLWENLRPSYIRNMISGTAHSTQGCQFWQPPMDWTTKCGWKWATNTKHIEYCCEEDL